MNEIEKINLTSKETCFFYSITKTTLTNWTGKGFPRGKRNQYPLVTGFRWWRKNIVGEEAGELQIEKLLRERARREQDQVKAEVAKNSVIQRETAIAWLTTIISEAKLHFRGIPARVAPVLQGRDEKEIQVILLKEIDDILWKMSGAKRQKVKELQAWERGIFTIKDGNKIVIPRKLKGGRNV